MSSLYFLPYYSMLALTILFIMAVILETYCTVYGFFSFRYDRKNLAVTLQEATLVLYLLVLLFCCAETLQQMSEGFAVPARYAACRRILYWLILLFSGAAAAEERNPARLGPGVLAILTLPGAERLAGTGFAAALLISGLLWIGRAVYHLYRYRKERREELSAFSVKEAMDRMNFGLLISRAGGISEGQILLCNRQMRNLMWKILGRPERSGKTFWEKLQAGQVRPGCRRMALGDFPVYVTEEDRVWRFEGQRIQVGNRMCFLLTASDITLYCRTNQDLQLQNQKLEQRNRELKEILRNLDTVVKAEQTIQAKSRVHDVLGQQISMVLRSVREQKKPDEKLLAALSGGLVQGLQAAEPDGNRSLWAAAESFQNLGVQVDIQGEMPEQPEIQRAFYEIASEAMTNAVHHGLSTRIRISIEKDDGAWKLQVENNGYVKEGPVKEGGGLQSMRRKAQSLGGSFCYEKNPRFTITVMIPEGEI